MMLGRLTELILYNLRKAVLPLFNNKSSSFYFDVNVKFCCEFELEEEQVANGIVIVIY